MVLLLTKHFIKMKKKKYTEINRNAYWAFGWKCRKKNLSLRRTPDRVKQILSYNVINSNQNFTLFVIHNIYYRIPSIIFLFAVQPDEIASKLEWENRKKKKQYSFIANKMEKHSKCAHGNNGNDKWKIYKFFVFYFLLLFRHRYLAFWFMVKRTENASNNFVESFSFILFFFFFFFKFIKHAIETQTRWNGHWNWKAWKQRHQHKIHQQHQMRNKNKTNLNCE